jgi:hypothetical protein
MSIVGRIAQALANKALAGAPPEFFLVAACCCWPPSAARVQAIRAATLASVDWPRLLRIVRKHRVWGLVQDGLVRATVPLPAEIAQEIRAEALALTQRNLVIAAEVLRLQRRFEEAGVPIIFVKGVSLSLLAYGDLSLKHSIDIDVLIAPAWVEAAKLVLDRAGYAPIEPLLALTPTQFELLMRYSKECGFLQQEKHLVVELHWRLSYNPLLMENIGPNSPIQSVRIAQTQIHTFCFEELFVYLCVHGAQHDWQRVKWLADLAALLSVRGDRDIETLYRAAQRAGAGTCAGQAMLLCERLLGLEFPVSLARELRQSTKLALFEALALDAMLGGGAETELSARAFGTLRVCLSLFFLGQGWRYALYEFRRYLVSPSDVLTLPLPNWLSWLYPILRLPLWIWRQLSLR